jgi:hypothetical protein
LNRPAYAAAVDKLTAVTKAVAETRDAIKFGEGQRRYTAAEVERVRVELKKGIGSAMSGHKLGWRDSETVAVDAAAQAAIKALESHEQCRAALAKALPEAKKAVAEAFEAARPGAEQGCPDEFPIVTTELHVSAGERSLAILVSSPSASDICQCRGKFEMSPWLQSRDVTGSNAAAVA